MIKPKKYKNHVFENVDFVCLLLFNKDRTESNFLVLLEVVNCSNINYFLVFVDQLLHINKTKSRLFMIFEM